MSQFALFDAPVGPTASSAEVALGDRISWTSGEEARTGTLVYRGPRLGYYGFSACWLERWEWEAFTKQRDGKLLRGGADAWVGDRHGELLIARTALGWWPIAAGVAITKVAERIAG